VIKNRGGGEKGGVQIGDSTGARRGRKGNGFSLSYTEGEKIQDDAHHLGTGPETGVPRCALRTGATEE